MVEAVNVDVCFHLPLNTETAVRRSRTRFVETTTGGYASIIATNSATVKQTFFLFYPIYFGIPVQANSQAHRSRNSDQPPRSPKRVFIIPKNQHRTCVRCKCQRPSARFAVSVPLNLCALRVLCGEKYSPFRILHSLLLIQYARFTSLQSPKEPKTQCQMNL